MTTPEQALGKVHARFGAHDRHRALHAKGVHCIATFTPTPEASTLTRAAHMSGTPVQAKVRFSNGGGDPTVPDYVPDVRGIAVSFQLADGTSTDILGQTIPRYPFHDQEGFFGTLAISKPGLAGISKIPLFLAKYPKAAMGLREADAILRRRVSFAAHRFFAFHAFKWIDSEGGERFVRYTWHPTVDEPEFSKAEAKAVAATTCSTSSVSASAADQFVCDLRCRSRVSATTRTIRRANGLRTVSVSRSARSRWRRLTMPPTTGSSSTRRD